MIAVGTLMTKDPITVATGTSVVEAAKLMRACNVESVLVAHQSCIVGILTDWDIVKKFVGAEHVSYFVPVEEIMSGPVYGIEEQRSLTDAAALMNKHHTSHLGVTKHGALVGVVSVRDLIRPQSVDIF